MPQKLPRITAQRIIAVLLQHGFFLVRQTGSHKIYKNNLGKRTTAPFHGGKILHPKVLKAIMRDAKITIDKL